MNDRKNKDLKTFEAMARIYCRAHHERTQQDDAGLCPDCRASVEATLARTQACPFGHTGNCQDCSIHCQRGEARERIRAIMRYAAPRMALRHPLMTGEYLRKKIAGRKRDHRG
ncbi:MAG: nitrous oxide-stimulated promoter family protein [Coriobacteriales bacterium]|nr:nitrous oxide-stimulated promoter family protein [Coriobacteriales bacterium]